MKNVAFLLNPILKVYFDTKESCPKLLNNKWYVSENNKDTDIDYNCLYHKASKLTLGSALIQIANTAQFLWIEES